MNVGLAAVVVIGIAAAIVVARRPRLTVAPGDDFRSAEQTIRVVGPEIVEIRERGKTARGRFEVDGKTFRISLDGGRDVRLRLTPSGLESAGGVVLSSVAARRESSAAIRKRMIENLVAIPGGRFELGSSSTEKDEEPPHHVRVSPFRISRFEVTQEEWEAIVVANPSRHRGNPRLPVETVSWDDCADFVKALNAIDPSTGWRLPTEAEWELAARNADGSEPFDAKAEARSASGWLGGNSKGETHPAGALPPNSRGLHDVFGNVWEWCGDWYGAYTSLDLPDPSGPSAGAKRVCRGGGYANDAKSVRAGKREAAAPDGRNDDLGLRLAASSK